MLTVYGETMEQAYKQAIKMVLANGEEVSPRGNKTIEVAPATIVVKDARKMLAAPTPRKINPCFGLAETLWFLRGSDDLEEIAHYNSVWRYFEDSDAKGVLNGAYGKRLRNWKGIDQLIEVYEKLKKDPYSRQAVAIIFDPERDNKIHESGSYSKDIPCTNLFNFHIRDNKLNMNVVMRSNDLHKGFVYDAHNFMIIQNILAGWLGVEVGKYEHVALSLHIYEDDMDNLINCLEDDSVIYTDTLELQPINNVDKIEFDKTMMVIEDIEAQSRDLVNIKSEIMKNGIVQTCIKLLEIIESPYWKSVAGCILVYNMRKAKINKHEWLKLVVKYINDEYFDLFYELSDLSDKK